MLVVSIVSVALLVIGFAIQWAVPAQAAPARSARVDTSDRRLMVVGLSLGIGSLLICAVIGLGATRSSRQAHYRSTERTNAAVARGLARDLHAIAANNGPLASRISMINALHALWEHEVVPYEGSYLCVIGDDGRLIMHTKRSDRVGLDVRDVVLPTGGDDGVLTVGGLLDAEQSWTGVNINAGGHEQVVSYLYEPLIGGLLVVHTPTSLIEADVRAAMLPWHIGLGALGVVLIPGLLSVMGLMHRHAIRAARTQHMQMEAVVGRMPVLLVAVDRDGDIIFWNQEAERVTGYTAAEACGGCEEPRAAFDFTTDGDTEGTHEIERTIVCRDGTTRVIAWTMMTTSAAIPGWERWAVGIDVSARSLAEQGLADIRRGLEQRVEERTLRLDQQLSRQSAVAGLNLAASQETELQATLERIVDIVTDELPATGGASIILWDPRTSQFTVSASTFTTRESGSTAQRVRRTGGATRWIIDNCRPLAVSDVRTDPFGANAMLAERGLAAYVGVPMIQDGRAVGVLYALDVDRRHYAPEDVDFLGVMAQCATTVVTATSLYERLAQTNNVLEERVRERTSDLESTNEQLRAEVTERARAEASRRRLEEQLYRLRKMEAVGTLASGVAHDVNNSLTAVLGYVSIARRNINAPDAVSEAINGIERAANQTARVAKALLDMSCPPTTRLETVDLGAMVRDEADVLLKLLPKDIVLGVHAATGWIRGCDTELRQLLMNLVLNARDAIGEHGVIQVRVERSPNPDRPTVELVVEDDGLGMSNEVRDRVFDPFFTTKRRGEGTGLGMTIVQSVVRRHAANIDLASDGGGTCVRVRFEEVTPAANAGSAQDTNASVLLVDPDPFLQALMSSALERAGCHVSTMSSMDEVVETVTNRADEFDVLIVEENVMDAAAWDRLGPVRRGDAPLIRIVQSGTRNGESDGGSPSWTVPIHRPFELSSLVALVMGLHRERMARHDAAEASAC